MKFYVSPATQGEKVSTVLFRCSLGAVHAERDRVTVQYWAIHNNRDRDLLLATLMWAELARDALASEIAFSVEEAQAALEIL